MTSTLSIVRCALLSTILTLASCDFELQLLHVVFRHGDKVPHREYQYYPNDPYRNHSYYPMGNGDLTNQGKMREYRIGTMLRERYDQYFGSDYWPDKIYAQSTDIPRTQLSLQLVLAGLYPPSEKQTWNPRLPWIPAWTFFVPSEVDNLLFPHSCPRYKEAYDRYLQQDHVKSVINKYKDVMEYLTKHSGKVINTTASVAFLYNLLKEEASQNLTLPKWTEKVYPSPMNEIIALDFKLRSNSVTLRRLNGGTLLQKAISDIRDYQAGKLKPPDRKAFLFSAHEVNVAAFARTLGTNEPLIPAYGSAIILETLRDKKGTYFVRVLLWTGVTEQLVTQTVPGCAELCPFDEFLRVVKDVIPNDDEYHCRPNKTSGKSEKHVYQDSSAANIAIGRFWPLVLMVVIFTLECEWRTDIKNENRGACSEKI
ncbi:hypothetical protein KM043_015820 [Ampulex compressa]|nr:hypothetical protein KM043_015820 [Ampulex compressa]